MRAVTDRGEFAALLGRLQRTGVGGALAYYVDTDDKDSTRYLVHATQSGIGLPDESYYRQDDYAEIRDKYVAHIRRMFELAGLEVDAERVFELERKLAAGHWDVVRRRDAELSYNLTTFDALAAEHPEFDWAAWTSALAEGPGPLGSGAVRRNRGAPAGFRAHLRPAVGVRSRWPTGRRGRPGGC